MRRGRSASVCVLFHPAIQNKQGTTAKEYNNTVLTNAKHYLIQTSLSSSIRETYGRFLGYVWYTYEVNPLPEDYVLLNFEMVKEAYAFQLWMNTDLNKDIMSYYSIPYKRP